MGVALPADPYWHGKPNRIGSIGISSRVREDKFPLSKCHDSVLSTEPYKTRKPSTGAPNRLPAPISKNAGKPRKMSIICGEAADLLETISQRIEQRERLEIELGADLRMTLRLPGLTELKRGLEILRRELARQQVASLAAE